MSASKATPPAAKRPYGSGRLYTRTDAAGRETYYARWYSDGREVKRRLGPKRIPNTGDGLTKTDAEAELRRLRAEVKPAGRAGDALTIADLGRRYIADLARQKRKKATMVAVESILRVWLEPFLGERDLRRISAEDVNDLIRMMENGDRPGVRQKGDRRYGKPVGAKSIRNCIGTLSTLLNFAERKGSLGSNVARRIGLPGAERGEDIHFLEVDGGDALVEGAQSGEYETIDRALYLTAAMTRLPQGELVALRWRDVDWPAARVRVRQNYVLGEFGVPKSRRLGAQRPAGRCRGR
jgi:integrase